MVVSNPREFLIELNETYFDLSEFCFVIILVIFKMVFLVRCMADTVIEADCDWLLLLSV